MFKINKLRRPAQKPFQKPFQKTLQFALGREEYTDPNTSGQLIHLFFLVQG